MSFVRTTLPVDCMSEKNLIAGLAREAIEIIAPQELPFFRAYSEAFFRDPSKLLVEKSQKDDILGFGMGDLIELVTGPALALAAIALSILADAARDALKSKTEASFGALIDRVVKAVRKRSIDPEVAQEWLWKVTPVELKQLRERLLEDARRLKLSETKAAQLADAVIAGIVKRLA